MNKIILIGRLTRDPECGSTQSDIKYARFTLAVDRKYSKDKENKEVDFINCTAWRGLAESIGKFAKKGKKVAVAGSLHINNYETSDGSKKTSAEVQIEECEFLSYEQEQKKESPKELEDLTPVPTEDDDLPF